MRGQRCSMAQMQHLPSGGSSIFPVLLRWYDQSSSRLHSLHTWFFNHHGDSVNYPTFFFKIPFWLKSANQSQWFQDSILHSSQNTPFALLPHINLSTVSSIQNSSPLPSPLVKTLPSFLRPSTNAPFQPY